MATRSRRRAWPKALVAVAGAGPKVGDVLVACPHHPGHGVVWTEEMEHRVAWRREAAPAREAGQ